MTAEEIWKECICDFLGDINIFSKSANGSLVVKEIINQTQAITKEQKAEPNQTRGAPDTEGKASREIDYTDYDKPITIEDVNILRSIGRKSINDFTADEIKKAQKWAYKFYKELGVKSPFFRAWFGEWRAHQNSEYITVVEQSPNDLYKSGKATNKDVNSVISWDRSFKGETINHLAREKSSQYALYDIGSIVENAILLDTEISMPGSKNKMDNTAFMHSFYTLYKTKDGGVNLIKMFVEEALANNEKVIFKRSYQLKDIQKIADIPNGVLLQGEGLTEDTSATKYSIADLYQLVKTFDKEFSAAPEVNPILLNDDGTPKVFYHGTNENFTEFRPEEMSSVEGSYFFAENREDAAAYGDNIYEVYLTGRKLADYDNQPHEFYQLRNKREQVAWLKERGYDGWYADMDSGGWGELSVFSANQVKSTAPVTYDDDGNVIPLSERFNSEEKDIRYSRELDALDYITHDEELEAVNEMAFSNRALLANALLDTITSSEEYKLVRSYQEEIAKLDAGDKRLAQLKKDLNQLYKQEKPNLEVIRELNEKDYTICAKYTKKNIKK